MTQPTKSLIDFEKDFDEWIVLGVQKGIATDVGRIILQSVKKKIAEERDAHWNNKIVLLSQKEGFCRLHMTANPFNRKCFEEHPEAVTISYKSIKELLVMASK